MSSKNNQSIFTDHVAEFETPASYKIAIPEGYVVSELAPAGSDFLVGASYVNCIHKKGTKAKEEACDISINSISDNGTQGSIEDDLKKAGNAVIGYRKIEFAGSPAFEVAFRLEAFQGYKIVFSHANRRIYSITAIVDSSDKISSVDEMKQRLSAVQKEIISSFRFI